MWWSGVHSEVLIGKLHAVNALTTGAVVVGEITALEHELRDNTVEGGALWGKNGIMIWA